MLKLREVILLLMERSPMLCPVGQMGGPFGKAQAGIGLTSQAGRPVPRRHAIRSIHFRDCHIEPDWILIYKIDGDDLHLVRTGTHSDLF